DISLMLTRNFGGYPLYYQHSTTLYRTSTQLTSLHQNTSHPNLINNPNPPITSTFQIPHRRSSTIAANFLPRSPYNQPTNQPTNLPPTLPPNPVLVQEAQDATHIVPILLGREERKKERKKKHVSSLLATSNSSSYFRFGLFWVHMPHHSPRYHMKCQGLYK
ncbi:hypothetical protein C7212DRAFT_319926, partial [Tuber magnatum]